MNADASNLPALGAHTILIDVDETITHTRDESFLEHVLRDVVATVHGVDDNEARRRIASVCDPQHEDVEPHLPELEIDPGRYDEALADAARPFVSPYSDAVAMIRTLHDDGFALYPATTNGRCVILAKMAAAGLADDSGCPHFKELFGGSQVEPAGKSGPAFYHALLRRIGAAPDEVVMVGDNPQADLAFAQSAGIHQVVLPRRDQPDPWVVESDGGIYVKSLALVPQMVTLRS